MPEGDAEGRFPRGTWVEIHRIVLAPGERAPRIPADTAAAPLEMRAKGFLLEPGAPGELVAILTRTGRRLDGTLAEASPPYRHGFGAPIAELSAIGGELRALLRAHRERR